MIRYPKALDQIEDAIEAKTGGWLQRATERTRLFSRLGRYAEKYVDDAGTEQNASAFWSEVKPVYLRRQYNKCVYCESRLEGGGAALVHWDLEHFRPKSNVRKWPKKPLYDFPTGEAWPGGYYLLAYHPLNYAASCKPCNTSFKSDYFPIAAARISGSTDPRYYRDEQPYLVYPLGEEDEDPEELITFVGAEAYPKHALDADPRRFRRARLMIDFFGLNRDGLVADRADCLLDIWSHVKLADTGDTFARRRLDRKRSVRAAFASCVRCFLALCATDRSRAGALIPELEKIVDLWQA
jgi:hypothetical protein